MRGLGGVIVILMSVGAGVQAQPRLVPTPEGPGLWSECFQTDNHRLPPGRWAALRSTLQWVQTQVQSARHEFPELLFYLDEAEDRFSNLKILCNEQAPHGRAYGTLDYLAKDFPFPFFHLLKIEDTALMSSRTSLHRSGHFVISIPKEEWTIHMIPFLESTLAETGKRLIARNRLLHEVLHHTSLNTSLGVEHRLVENTPIDWDNPCDENAVDDRVTLIAAVIAKGGLHGYRTAAFPDPRVFMPRRIQECGWERACLSVMQRSNPTLRALPSRGLSHSAALQFCSKLALTDVSD